MLYSCSGEKANVEDEKLQNMLVEDCPEVTVAIVKNAQFNNEIVSNGKATASRYADVYWDVDGVIAKIMVANGQQISEGSVIAQLDAFRTSNSYESASADMEKARLSMYEAVIGQGYDPDSANIPENIKHLAEIKSGYLQSKASYMAAKYDYEHSTLTSPISGVVANLKDKESNKADRNNPFCRIIDMSSMTAEFNVIENELPLVSVGEEVTVSAFAKPDKTWKGIITEINPYIEKNGMVKVVARINGGNDLYEGMNISVKIRKELGERMAVPKSAVVLRSNKPVVFTAKSGLAQWHYVETSIENSEYIAISSSEIAEGDSVIITGNTFLAHNSKVKVGNR